MCAGGLAARVLVPLRCDRAGCVAKIKAWDWNVPGYEERPGVLNICPKRRQPVRNNPVPVRLINVQSDLALELTSG